MQTKYHGEIEVTEQDIWQFDRGLPGFEEEKYFVVLPLPDNEIFSILQSTSTPSLAFVVANPFSFFKDYDFTLDDATVAQLELDREEDVIVSVILTVRDPFEKTTANLQAPVIFNRKNQKGKQVILTNSDYETKHPIMPNQREQG